MSKQTTEFFGSVEKTLAKLYKDNRLDDPSELPLIGEYVYYLRPNGSFFLAPNGDFLWYGKFHHITVQECCIENPCYPNGVLKPLTEDHKDSFFRDLNIIMISYEEKPYNRLDFLFLSPVTPAQLKSIYRTYKSDPTLWITYDIVNPDDPPSASGEGHREMIEDLRKKSYLPNE